MVKVDILVNSEKVDALSELVHRELVVGRRRKWISKERATTFEAWPRSRTP